MAGRTLALTGTYSTGYADNAFNKRYTANTRVARTVPELIDQYGGRLVLEAVADYCFQHLGLRCFATGFGQAAEQLGSAEGSGLGQVSCSATPAGRDDCPKRGTPGDE